MQTYKELLIWQKSKALALFVYKVTAKFPTTETYGLTSQMNRCAISIPSNIAEGWSRQSTKEFIHFLYISRGSLSELETQLEIAQELGLVPSEAMDMLCLAITELGKMITTAIKRLKDKTLTANR